MSELTIGQEIEAYCGKCKDNTLHLITAIEDDKIEKVMCKSCLSYHKYRKSTNSLITSTTKKAVPKKKTTRSRRTKNDKLLDETDFTLAVEYKMDQSYEALMPIHHKTFGFGVVKSVIDNQKIEVLFQDCEKILVQNYNSN